MAVKSTDVIVVGNGPSAICLSYLLSGYRPYYNGLVHPNSILSAKLQNNRHISIVEQVLSTPYLRFLEVGEWKPYFCSYILKTYTDQDLSELCEGLEGRSPNPVALLLDALTHPEADLGAEIPPCLAWQREQDHHIPHIVLGKAAAGGAWQQMDGDMHTLSLSNWMELPSVPFKEWLACRKRNKSAVGSSSMRNERASISDVRNYYSDFVAQKELSNNFCDHSTVTSVRKVYQLRNSVDEESGEVEPCCQNVKENHSFHWEVRGYRNVYNEETEEPIREEFCYHAPYVVLATGTFDIPNRLGSPGENLPFVCHTLSEFEQVIKEGQLGRDSDPVVIVGAGLTAADAVIMARRNNIPVEHVFRRSASDSNLVFRKLPVMMYPEYHKIHAMMKGQDQSYDLYQNHSKHKIVECKPDKKVILEGDGKEHVIQCSAVVILIGSRPDLSFMPCEGRSLGLIHKCAIDCRHNPIEIDPYSYQSLQEPGLFAIGPLIGDNFVRFIRGGSLGITNYLWRKGSSDKF